MRLIRDREAAWAALFFGVTATLSLWHALNGWTNPILETHGFRQTQTAISAYYLRQDGFRLDYATPVMGAPWAIPFEFPLYQWVTAQMSRLFGSGLDATGRAVSLGFFYTSLPAIGLILRGLKVSPSERWLFLALLVVTPVYQFFARTFLIESTAFSFGVWYLWAVQRALHSRTAGAFCLAASLGIMAGLVKSTTLAVALIPTAALFVQSFYSRRMTFRHLVLWAIAAVGPGIIASVMWLRFTDAVKIQNIIGVTQTSASLRTWNFGTWTQRFTSDFWQQIAMQIERTSLPVSSLLLAAVFSLLFMRQQWRRLLIIATAALAGPFVFANLYYVHDYYFFSNGVLLLLLLALPLAQVWRNAAIPLVARLAIVALAIGTQFSGYQQTYAPGQTSAVTAPPDVAIGLRAVTRPDDVILGLGLHWSSVTPYYSERRALMVPHESLSQRDDIGRAVDRLAAERIAAIVTAAQFDISDEFYVQLFERLEISPDATFATSEQIVYLRKDLEASANELLPTLDLPHLWINRAGANNISGESNMVVHWLKDMAQVELFDHMQPQPEKITTPWSLGSRHEGTRRIFFANPSTEVSIVAPATAFVVRAEFGIEPGAYAQTDGVQFSIALIRNDGVEIPLFARLLNPRGLISDRGLQTVELTTAGPIEGRVVFRTDPGPAQSDSFDWSYWGKLEIK